ncbi:Wzz/FepE/Etk N-terminal domain-containing protein [Alphaproteobacteria bacterium]|nr:Wzz/FepE/Etk N-terminal domain-containing protein [Alphaproteobacteria bacterium]
MPNLPSTYDDEIDLLSLILTIWEGKWKIIFIMAVSLLSVFGFNIFKPNTTFTASTEIKPITSFEFDKYSLFNSSLKIIYKRNEVDEEFSIFEITQENLLNLYIEEIQEGSLLETAVYKFNLINKENFNSESDYKEAIEIFVSNIEVLKPINEKLSHHVLSAQYNDKDKWKNLLTFVNEEANRKVKTTLINRFATIVSIENQKRDFSIKDIDIKIENAKNDYGKNTKNRLAFLTEQAAIARKLDIQKNTIASQRFNAQNTFVTNVKTDAPFYLRGYLAIEEEIRQIKNRKDKNAFTDGLYGLEQQKRTLEQDETIERAIGLFDKTPLNQDDFKATIVKVATTYYKIINNKNLYYVLAIVLGGIIGVVYVLITDAFKKRKTNIVNS